MFTFNVPKLLPVYLFSGLILLTSLRNLSSIYLALVGIGLVYFLLKNYRPLYVFKPVNSPYYFFLLFTFLVIFWSFFYMLSLEPLVGIPRALLMPLLAMIFFINLDKDEDFVGVIKVVLFCFTLGGLSLVYQFLFDPISWFSPSATRGVLVRFSSILGSLTVYGSIIGYFFILIFGPLNLLRNVFFRMFFFSVLIVSVAISLQKTALFILVISFFILLIYNTRLHGMKMKASHLLSLVLILIVAPILIVSDPIIQKYISTLLSITSGIDVSLFSSSFVAINDVNTSTISWYEINMRLYKFTSLAYQEYGNYIWFFGIGLKGGAGVMGMDGYSAHNGFLELLIMGGPLYLLISIYLIVDVQIYLFKNIRNKLAGTFFLLNIVFIILAIVTAGALFQPSVCILFWLSLAYVYKRRSSSELVGLRDPLI